MYKTSQDIFMQDEVDKIVSMGEGDKVSCLFMPKIISTKLSRGFTMPDVTSYDETSDPRVFLSLYKYAMIYQGLCLPVHMCKIFPEYLSGIASYWFSGLPRNSIASFRDFVTTFFNRFFQKSCAPRSTIDILNVKQKKDEPFSNYLTRFTTKP